MALGPGYYTAGKRVPQKIYGQVITQIAPNTALCLVQKQQKAQSNAYNKHFKYNINVLIPTMYLPVLSSNVVIDLCCQQQQ